MIDFTSARNCFGVAEGESASTVFTFARERYAFDTQSAVCTARSSGLE
ncbi:MAG: hypothetical protein ACXW4P_11870 [Thermoanaerobaculia bacterium]